MMAVPIFTAGVFEFGTPSVLFRGKYATRGSRHYDVAADGRRFLMIKEHISEEMLDHTEIHIVLNWFEELKRIVPTND